MVLITQAIGSFLSIYSALLIIRILLSWFPNIDWMSQPFAALSQLTDPYLNVFRSFIPSLGGIDLSPILAILAIQFAQGLVAQAAQAVVSYPMAY
ncbi:MAG: YggT family protein [Elainellaceae cyanobacterium]